MFHTDDLPLAPELVHWSVLCTLGSLATKGPCVSLESTASLRLQWVFVFWSPPHLAKQETSNKPYGKATTPWAQDEL